MAACAFRRSFDFKDSPEGTMIMGTYSYHHALQIVLDNAILITLVLRQYLRNSWLPRNLQVLSKAADDFRLHMTRMLEEEAGSHYVLSHASVSRLLLGCDTLVSFSMLPKVNRAHYKPRLKNDDKVPPSHPSAQPCAISPAQTSDASTLTLVVMQDQKITRL